MASGIAGSKGSTSPSPRPRRDKFAPRRDLRVLQSLMMQGLLFAALLIMAWISRSETRAMALYLVSLVIPVSWALAAWQGHRRVEKARAEGSWSAEWERGQTRRTLGFMGAVFVAWVLAVMAVVFWL